MGQSPSADLFYGYDLGNLTDKSTYDDLRPEWMQDEEADEEEHFGKRSGWVEVPFPSNIPDPDYRLSYEERRRLDDARRDTDEYRTWSANRDQLRGLVKACPVELHRYGYSEEPSYCVRVKASVQCADDWGSVALKPLEADPAWDEQLAEYMRLMGFTVPDGVTPGWHMNCSYG